MDDDELLARLKAKADAAWAESARLARLADADNGFVQSFWAALGAAQQAQANYNALAPGLP